MEVSYNELRSKEVVNVLCGQKLGRVCDVIISTVNRAVLGIVVPGERKLFHVREDLFIPWNNINSIGTDIILVTVDADNCTNIARTNACDIKGDFLEE